MLRNVLLKFLDDKDVLVLKWQISNDKPSTAQAYKALKKCSLLDKQINLFVSIQDVITQASFANISNVRSVFFDQPNVCHLATKSKWLVLEKDLDLFKGMVKQWI